MMMMMMDSSNASEEEHEFSEYWTACQLVASYVNTKFNLIKNTPSVKKGVAKS